MAQNGVPGAGVMKAVYGEHSEVFQKLLQEDCKLKETLRLERSRNADTDCKKIMGRSTVSVTVETVESSLLQLGGN